jgi:hypothetical protein
MPELRYWYVQLAALWCRTNVNRAILENLFNACPKQQFIALGSNAFQRNVQQFINKYYKRVVVHYMNIIHMLIWV